MKKTLVLPIIGLIAGLLIGGTILYLQNYAAKQLLGLLSKELDGSCRNGSTCELLYDSVELSFFSLRAKAHNVRVQENGHTNLGFKRLEADFSLEKIRQHTLLLTELRLIDGFSIGVGPDSTTYRFVDFLGAPIPPERNTPDRWRVKLRKLKLSDSSFSEQIGSQEVHGKNSSLVFKQSDSGDFTIDFEVPSAGTDLLPQATGILRGGLAVSQAKVEIKKIEFLHPALEIQATALVDAGKISGNSAFTVRPGGAIPRLRALKGKFNGELQFDGDESTLTLSGRSASDSIEPLLLALSEDYSIDLQSLNLDFRFAPVKLSNPQLELEALEIRSLFGQTSLEKPLNLSDASFTSALKLSLPPISFDFGETDTFAGRLELSSLPSEGGTGSALRLDLHGATSAIRLGDGIYGPVSIKANSDLEHAEISILEGLGSTKRLDARARLRFEPHLGIDEIQFSSNRLPLYLSGGGKALFVSGIGSATEPLSLQNSAGQSNLKVDFDDSTLLPPLSADLKLDRGILELKGKLDGIDVGLSAKHDMSEHGRTSMIITADDFNPALILREKLDPSGTCGSLSAKAEYSFDVSQPLGGDGSIAVTRLNLGCEPYRLSLTQSALIPIKAGSISLEALNLSSKETEVTVDGSASMTSGIDLDLKGRLELASLLPLLPKADNLEGLITLDIKVAGETFAPVITGKASISNTSFDVEAVQLGVTDLNGVMSIDSRFIKFDSIDGRINDGPFAISGTIDMDNPENSEINLKIEELFLEPFKDASLGVSADLKLSSNDNNTPTISGLLRISEAVFERQFDLASIVRNVTRSIFRRPLKVAEDASLADLPDVELDVRIQAPGSVHIATNFASVDMSADLRLVGTPAEPVLQGKMEVVSGWVGLRDRRFNISSGEVTFAPHTLLPQIDILAESTARSRQGDLVLVLLEARGPIVAPKITLDSDRGLSERELLLLLTSSQSIAINRRYSTVGQGVEFAGIKVSEDESLPILGRIVRDLTRIDSLAIEPSFNAQRGVVEPIIVAQKKIFDNLTIRGESTLSSTENDSSLDLIFGATRRLDITGSLLANQSTGSAALAVDAAYTFYGTKRDFLEIDIIGEKALTSREILSELKLRSDSRIDIDAIQRLQDKLHDFYRSRAFLSAHVAVSCEEFHDRVEKFCRSLTIKIDEGPVSIIKALRLSGSLPPSTVSIQDLEGSSLARPATERLRKSLYYAITARLRSEGYIAARVDVRYSAASPTDRTNSSQSAPEESSRLERDVDLEVAIWPGSPVSFIFEGNTVFRPQDFLETINLFERKRPFGKNTINILLENMERMYSERGYLYATASSQESPSPDSSRLNYIVTIDEGPQIFVSEVRFVGNTEVTTEHLHELLVRIDPNLDSKLFRPKHAVPEELQNYSQLIGQIYAEEGFPQAKVVYQIQQNDDASKVTIIYEISEGANEKADWLRVTGFPKELDLPNEPAAPYSIPKANQYIDELVELLRNEGFEQASISSSLEESGSINLDVAAGPRCMIDSISVSGNSTVSEQTIFKELDFAAGDPWRQAAMDSSRRKLLRLGLFGRVEINSLNLNGNGCRKSLSVRVEERELRSLKGGIGANSELGLHFFGEATDWALFADGKNFSLRLDAYYDEVGTDTTEGIASLTYSDPGLFGSDLGYISDVRFQRLDLDSQEFDLDRIGWSNFLRYAWEEGYDISGGYTFFQENLDNVSPDAILSEFDSGIVTLGFLSGVFNYEGRDSPLNPTKGVSLGLDYQAASQGLGSDANFFGLAGRISYLTPLSAISDRLSVFLGTRAGAQWAYGGDDYVPISQRLYLGGRTTVRGFRENSLGPRGSEGSVLGGDLLFAQNLELHYAITDNLVFLTFLDAGGLYLREQTVTIDDLRESAGAGVRFLSPIGPIGLDLGVPLDERSGEPSMRVHFTIGNNF